jgi:hypothetical protein
MHLFFSFFPRNASRVPSRDSGSFGLTYRRCHRRRPASFRPSATATSPPSVTSTATHSTRTRENQLWKKRTTRRKGKLATGSPCFWGLTGVRGGLGDAVAAASGGPTSPASEDSAPTSRATNAPPADELVLAPPAKFDCPASPGATTWTHVRERERSGTAVSILLVQEQKTEQNVLFL